VPACRAGRAFRRRADDGARQTSGHVAAMSAALSINAHAQYLQQSPGSGAGNSKYSRSDFLQNYRKCSTAIVGEVEIA
jgi:hypothetical protein